MNYVDNIEIEGFWETKKVSLKLHEDLNFLIGPNGSGKTTIINLLSAALRADIQYLYSIQFTKISIRLKTIGSNIKPIIEITKERDSKMGSLNLEYNIRSKTTDPAVTYGVEGPFEERVYLNHLFAGTRRHRETDAQLSSILSKLVEVNWLSIHRTKLESDGRILREETVESTVDRKLNEISRSFSNYYSLLSSKAESESKNFQEQVFLSLLDHKHTDSDVFRAALAEGEDRTTLVGVLKDLGVRGQRATKSVQKHSSKLRNAKKKLKNKQPIGLDDAIVLSDAVRIAEMIDEWRDLQKRRNDIFRPRSQFEEIINSHFSGKTLHFDERNAPRVLLNNEQNLEIGVLSSGEKQLFILLGEALLQEGRPVVFISDEPELSLHVSWQSALFKNVRKLNSACQVISATHSPDIVGPAQDRVIHVEECIVDVH